MYKRWSADRVVVEVNQGGDLVARVLRTVDPSIAVKEVRATRGKVVRAEPCAALYEQGKVWHIGTFPELERQMSMFTTDFDVVKMGFSPDRVDALVWGLTELLVELQTDGIIAYYGEMAAAAQEARGG
jgi:phage terminase large subunit-like protein